MTQRKTERLINWMEGKTAAAVRVKEANKKGGFVAVEDMRVVIGTMAWMYRVAYVSTFFVGVGIGAFLIPSV